MSTAGKAIIIISLCLLVIVVGIVGAGIYWWTQHGRQTVEATVKTMEDGEEAGKKTDNQGCLDQALAHYKKEEGFGGALSTSLFLQGCLQRSSPTPGFCDEVPGPNDLLKGSAWQHKKCKDAGVPSNQYYRQIFAGVQQFCQRERMKPRE